MTALRPHLWDPCVRCRRRRAPVYGAYLTTVGCDQCVSHRLCPHCNYYYAWVVGPICPRCAVVLD